MIPIALMALFCFQMALGDGKVHHGHGCRDTLHDSDCPLKDVAGSMLEGRCIPVEGECDKRGEPQHCAYCMYEIPERLGK